MRKLVTKKFFSNGILICIAIIVSILLMYVNAFAKEYSNKRYIPTIEVNGSEVYYSKSTGTIVEELCINGYVYILIRTYPTNSGTHVIQVIDYKKGKEVPVKCNKSLYN